MGLKIKKSGAKYSAIVGIGEKLSLLERDSNDKYLRLNRGIPAVTNIDLTEIIPLIDFNQADIQIYPPNSGHPKLKAAINKYYFQSSTQDENIFITAGGINALDLVFKTIDTEKVILPEFYWGAYANILKINQQKSEFYNSFEELTNNLSELKDSTILICDPNNPLGNKYDDTMLLDTVSKLNANGTSIIWDSPYRKLFYDENDEFYSQLKEFEHLIIVESFSKSIGLSGQRLGFVHSTNKDFNKELNINILYATNGINNFAQILVEKILSTKEGQKAAKEFRDKTIKEMQLNIEYLRNNKLLAEEFYQSSTPIGIFTVVNKSEEELLKHKIGSVGLYYFTQTNKELGEKYARLCIAVPHKDLKAYFDTLIK